MKQFNKDLIICFEAASLPGFACNVTVQNFRFNIEMTRTEYYNVQPVIILFVTLQ